MNPVVVSLGLPDMGARVASAVAGEDAKTVVRRFPDGETYVRFETEVRDRDVVIVADLAVPDDKIIPLLWVAATAKDLGAARVGLTAPYLPYMRQDARFQPGEGVTSRYFARVMSSHVDWLVTVDPHLHRYRSLDEVYAIPSRVVSAAPVLARWIEGNVQEPLLIGPDAESGQWVRAVADAVGAPHVVLTKTRAGDHDVRVEAPNLREYRNRSPVIIDDVISTGSTLAEAARLVRGQGLAAPVCVAVHAVCSGNAYDRVMAAGCRAVATCNTVPHASNAIDVSGPLSDGIRSLLSAPPR
ncbi:MAG: ribose-phosphate pyrophosphokinase [Nitrospirota bacterium]